MELLCCENVIFKQEMRDLILGPPCLNRLAEMHLVHQFQTGLPLPEWGRCWTFKSTFRQNTFSLHEKKKNPILPELSKAKESTLRLDRLCLDMKCIPFSSLAGREKYLPWMGLSFSCQTRDQVIQWLASRPISMADPGVYSPAIHPSASTTPNEF